MKSKSIFVAFFASLTAAAALSAMPATARGGEIFVGYDGGIGAYDATTGATINDHLISPVVYSGGYLPLAFSGGNLFAGAEGNEQPGSGVVGEYTTSGGTVNASLVTGLNFPTGIALSGSDLFVPNNDGVVGEYTTSGGTVNASFITLLSASANISLAVSGGDLFVENSYLGTVGEYDATTGATINASLIAGLDGIAIAVSGGNLFVTNGGTGSIAEYTTSGALVNAEFVTGLWAPVGIAVSGGDLFVVNGDNAATWTVGEYDATTGATINAALVTGLNGASGIAVVTPEPSTWVMFSVGVAALLGCGLCRHRSSASGYR